MPQMQQQQQRVVGMPASCVWSVTVCSYEAPDSMLKRGWWFDLHTCLADSHA